MQPLAEGAMRCRSYFITTENEGRRHQVRKISCNRETLRRLHLFTARPHSSTKKESIAAPAELQRYKKRGTTVKESLLSSWVSVLQ